MRKVLLIIDVQNDFVTGSLGSEYAKDVVVPNIKKLIPEFKQQDRFATLDIHFDDSYLESQEGRNLPIKHCIFGTNGCKIVKELNRYILTDCAHRIIKFNFGAKSIDLYNSFSYSIGLPDEIHICGLVTDICVISNALILKSIFPERKIIVHESCCGGTSKEAHDAAIKVMKSCQIDIV